MTLLSQKLLLQSQMERETQHLKQRECHLMPKMSPPSTQVTFLVTFNYQCEVYLVIDYGLGLTNQSKGLEWRQAIARDVSEQLLKSAYALISFFAPVLLLTFAAGTAVRRCS
jgi:hypothetical protein